MSDNKKDLKNATDDITETEETTETNEVSEVKEIPDTNEEEKTEKANETCKSEEAVENNAETNALVPICTGCGSKLEPNQAFCPKCGKKVVNDIPQNSLLTVEQKPKKNKKKTIIIAACVAAAVVIGIVAFVLLRGTPVEKLKLEEKDITLEESTLEENYYYTLKCTVYPENATDKKIVWSSSDDDIAKVNKKGEIMACKSGECTITATASNGVKAKCKVTVEKPAPNLQYVYNQLNDTKFCELGTDGSYLSIDTNPYDYDDDSIFYDSSDVLEGTNLIKEANNLLGLPSSVYRRMNQTTAINGTQTYSGYKLEVSWTYHPDNGLEVMYEIKN